MHNMHNLLLGFENVSFLCSKKRKSVPQKSPPTATKKLGQDSFVML